jgi:hypothetical protein
MIDSGEAVSLAASSGGFLGESRRNRLSPVQSGARHLRRLQIAAAKNATHGYGINEVRVSRAIDVGADLRSHLERSRKSNQSALKIA